MCDSLAFAWGFCSVLPDRALHDTPQHDTPQHSTTMVFNLCGVHDGYTTTQTNQTQRVHYYTDHPSPSGIMDLDLDMGFRSATRVDKPHACADNADKCFALRTQQR